MRRFPGSRRHPHFAREQLEPFLRAAGIDYLWLPELGGRRTPRKDSQNTGWQVAAFRGYADYAETPEFEEAFTKLLAFAETRRAAIMCAEALWWQCHRRIIADVLASRGHAVLHIQTPTKAPPHTIAPPAHLVGGRLSYASPQTDLDLE